ncbi:MAG: RNase adapter RapZ [Firmicutes bacterium]|nr:RNase adapter RapZ [Bacillota bacterium]
MTEPIECVLITGLSGAGKSVAGRFFEDAGYFVIDNLPPILIERFVELCSQTHGSIDHIALVTDLRSGDFFPAFYDAVAWLRRQSGIHCQVLFLEADDEILVRRYKESRRRHPSASPGESPLDGIGREREQLATVRGMADLVINTSALTPKALKELLTASFGTKGRLTTLQVSILSLGFKYGLPLDSDLVFDVRFLPNPYYDENLRPLSGKDEPVRRFVLETPIGQALLDHLSDLLDFLIPQYESEGRSHLVIAIGCTGGRHRSVAIAEWLAQRIGAGGGVAHVVHRDLQRDLLERRE